VLRRSFIFIQRQGCWGLCALYQYIPTVVGKRRTLGHGSLFLALFLDLRLVPPGCWGWMGSDKASLNVPVHLCTWIMEIHEMIHEM
jgi:hypothetical protein